MISAALVRPTQDPAYIQQMLPMVLLRSLLSAIIIFSLDAAFPLGTSGWMLTFAACLGTTAASLAAFTRLTNRGFISLSVIVYFVVAIIFKLLNYFPAAISSRFFAVYALTIHGYATLIVFLASALLTWGFWRSKHILSLELLGLLWLVVYLFSGHRNFHFDSPQIINTLAWWLNVEPITLLITLGALVFIILFGNLFLATHPNKPDASITATHFSLHRGQRSWTLNIAFLGLLATCLYLISTSLYSHYTFVAGSRLANGVGAESKEGLSPLGFHSALGSTNQPSALVRLEGDYSENPFSPMLYLRESALSKFNGHELTIASRIFDQDVSNTSPSQPFQGQEDPTLGSRVPLSQSVYLLTEHKLAFAADYPITISPVKNPNPSRFKSAFKAYSIAPGFSLQSLLGLKVGDPRWTSETKAHYLETHPDPRYAELALKLTAAATNPIEKALAIVEYFNKTAIYTLTPNHNVGPQDDPVAPFAFGDHRGYCVHFAHALTYLYRSLGIPARIGTGYLTDLSQAKDGHTLLRMSDRHAWAEVYIEGHGWIPFDLQPEQVESHADTQVDMKVLEELMTLLEPGDEVLPKDLLKDEKFEQHSENNLEAAKYLSFLILAALAIIFLIKIYLHYSWILPSSYRTKLRRSYLAILTRLHDLGFRRDFGETRQEFKARLAQQFSLATLSLTELQQKSAYQLPSPTAVVDKSATLEKLALLRKNDLTVIRNLPLKKRILAIINPSSAMQFIFGPKW